MAATKKTTSKSAPAKKAAATSTERASIRTAPQAAGFDAKGNKSAALAERAARNAGKTVQTAEYTVAPGRTVRQGGVNYGQGEVVTLTKADAERMLAKGNVMEGEGGAKAVREAQAAADAQREADEAAANEQREADEKAAQEKAAADEAAGKVSGAENR